jgi:hypothetical protein
MAKLTLNFEIIFENLGSVLPKEDRRGDRLTSEKELIKQTMVKTRYSIGFVAPGRRNPFVIAPDPTTENSEFKK